MDISEIDPTALEFTNEELDALGMILTKAQEIQKDLTLYRLVMKHIDKKIKDFKSVDDLKKHSMNLAKEEADKKEKEPDNDEDDK